MDGIANVARQQQSQIGTEQTQGRVAEQVHQMQPQKSDVVEQLQEKASQEPKINSEKDVKDLVEQLNKAMAPMNTSLKFGVDRDDIFYVSVIEEQSHKMIRRFPAEKAAEFLPKMQEVTGILFDSKG
jgi:flagellar protein FlaG